MVEEISSGWYYKLDGRKGKESGRWSAKRIPQRGGSGENENIFIAMKCIIRGAVRLIG